MTAVATVLALVAVLLLLLPPEDSRQAKSGGNEAAPMIDGPLVDSDARVLFIVACVADPDMTEVASLHDLDQAALCACVYDEVGGSELGFDQFHQAWTEGDSEVASAVDTCTGMPLPPVDPR